MSASRSRRFWPPILFGLALIVSLFVLDRAGAMALHAILLQSDNRLARVYAGGRTDDVVIIGNSVANAIANPVTLSRQSGAKVFLLAVHGLDAQTQYALIEDYLKFNRAPRLVFMEVRTTRAELVRAPEFGLFAEGGTHMDATLSANRDTLIPWRSVFHLYRLNSPLLATAVQSIFDRDDQANSASNGRMTPQIEKAWLQNSAGVGVDSKQRDAFIETINLLQRHNVRVVVIASPLYTVARPQAEVIRTQVIPRLPVGAIYCDYVDYFNDPTVFEDPAHFNSHGRSAFAPTFVALIDVIVRGSGHIGDGAPAAIDTRCRTVGANSGHA